MGAMASPAGIQVFLSHVPSDRRWARELAQQLAAAGLKVFDPIDELFPGDNWSLKIGTALDESTAMVVLLSPEAVKSNWVLNEIQYALGSEKFQHRLIPVEVEPTEDFPWILRKMQWVRGNPAEAGRQIVKILERAGNHKVNADAH
jgi:hypothetical protein